MKLSVDFLVQVSQEGTLVLGSLGVWVAMINQRRQLNAQVFIEMLGRFQELLRLFPTEAWLANLNPTQPLPPRSREITDCTLYCIQLIADANVSAPGTIYFHQNLECLGARNQTHFQGTNLSTRVGRAERWNFPMTRVLHYINALTAPKQRTRAAAAPCDPLIGES